MLIKTFTALGIEQLFRFLTYLDTIWLNSNEGFFSRSHLVVVVCRVSMVLENWWLRGRWWLRSWSFRWWGQGGEGQQAVTNQIIRFCHATA